jgi:hypothetical protein
MYDEKFIYITQGVIAVAISLLGGVARICSSKTIENITGFDIIKELFVSGFAGLMIFFVVPSKEEWGFAIAGMAGFTAPYTLNYLAIKFKKILEGVSSGNS